MKKVFALIVPMAIALSVNAQKVNGVIIEDRPLEWKDFKGKPSSNIFDAKTYTSIGYQSSLENNKHLYKITCLFDPKKSWVSKEFLKKSDNSMSAHLLKHEQGHYDIARIIASDLDRAINSFSYDKLKARYQCDSIFRSYLKKEREMQDQYDKDTNHSKVPEEQAKWNEKIKLALDKRSFEM